MVAQRCIRALSCSSSIVVVLLMVVSDFRTSAQPVEGSHNLDLDTWEAPRDVRLSFPYYISGLDYKGQTVFVMEYGKWNVRKYLEDGGDYKTLDTYADQMFYRWSKAERNLPPSDNSTGTGLFGMIVDFEGYELRQLAHLQSLGFTMEMARKFLAVPAPKMDYGNLIKMNSFAEVLMTNFVGPILGDVYSKMKSSGINKEEWVPLLLEKIPQDSLPVWYGGSSSFEPLAVYG